MVKLFIACYVLISCNPHKEHHKENIKFKITSPIKKDTVITKDYVCQIHAIRHIELRALEKGYLQKIWVDEGQFIKKGQPMFKIMPNVYEAELNKAKAEADVASIEYNNTKLLAKSNIVSPNELAMSKAKYEKANAEVLMAKTHLGFTNINAPFTGIMDHFHVREGSLLDEGELLTTLSDNSKMWVYFNVPEAEYLDFMNSDQRERQRNVSLLMANNQVFDQEGVVKTIEGEFNNETGNIAFRATFPNPKGLLRHGETGSILMKIPLNNALLIPQKATFEVLDKTYVFVVSKEGTVHQKEVQIGAELPHLFVVSKGLTTTDRILLDGLRLVRDGQKIEQQYTAPAKVLTSLDLYAE